MAGVNGAAAGADESFSSIDEALGSYVEDDQDDAGQGGQDQQQPNEGQQQADGQDDQPQDVDPDNPDGGEDELELDPEIDPQQDQPGAFAAPETQVKLADGTTTTVAELLRTRTEAGDVGQRASKLEQERREFDGVRQQVKTQYESLQPMRERIAAFAQALMPKEPDLSMLQTNPDGYHYLMRAYQDSVGMLNRINADYEGAQKQQETEATEALKTFRSEQGNKLVQRDPKFGDDAYYRQFWNDALSFGGRVYGYSADELKSGMNDHRQYLVMRDAIAYRKLKAQQAKGKGAQQQRQPNGQQNNGQQRRVITGSQRPGNPDLAKRQQADARFNKNPTLKNALDLID